MSVSDEIRHVSDRKRSDLQVGLLDLGARDTPTSKAGATGTRKSPAAATDGPTAEASTSNVD